MDLQSRAIDIDTQVVWSYLIVTIFFLVLATVSVAARFVSRRLKPIPLGIDDWLMLFGLV